MILWVVVSWLLTMGLAIQCGAEREGRMLPWVALSLLVLGSILLTTAL